MQPKPFVIAAGVSLLLQAFYYVLVQVVAYIVTADVVKNLPSSGLPTILVLAPSLGCLGWILAPLVNGGTGFLYAYLHQRQALLSNENSTLGGAFSAGLASILAGLLNILLSLLVLSISNPMPGTSLPGSPFPANTIGSYLSAFTGLVGVCAGALLAAAFGAIGGLLGGLAFTRTEKA